MGCSKAHPSYWIGICVLSLAFGLSLAALVSPYWREYDGADWYTIMFRAHEGLWECLSDFGDEWCQLTQGGSGLWRVIQALEVLSCVCLLCGWLGAVACLKGAHLKTTKGCHQCAAAAVVTGAVFGLSGDLAHVGHVELYTRRLDGDVSYSWAFALSTAGHLLAFVAAVAILASATCFRQRYTSVKAKPYLEDYTLEKVGTAPVQYVYTLPAHLGPGYYIKRRETWPRKGQLHDGGYQHHLADVWPVKGDYFYYMPEKQLVKGDYYATEKYPIITGVWPDNTGLYGWGLVPGSQLNEPWRVDTTETHKPKEEPLVLGKYAWGSAVGQHWDRTPEIHELSRSDNQDPPPGHFRPIENARTKRGATPPSGGTSPLVDPLLTDAANKSRDEHAHYIVQSHGAVTEASVAHTDKVQVFKTPSGGERLVYRTRSATPDPASSSISQYIPDRQPVVTLPWKRYLSVPDGPPKRKRSRVLIKMGKDRFFL